MNLCELSMYLFIHPDIDVDVDRDGSQMGSSAPWSPPLSSQEASTKTTFWSINLGATVASDTWRKGCWDNDSSKKGEVSRITMLEHTNQHAKIVRKAPNGSWLTAGAIVQYQLPGSPGPKPSDSGSASADVTVALQPETWRSLTNLLPSPLGAFHKYGYPQMDRLFHGKSYSKWMMTGGTRISGNLHLTWRPTFQVWYIISGNERQCSTCRLHFSPNAPFDFLIAADDDGEAISESKGWIQPCGYVSLHHFQNLPYFIWPKLALSENIRTEQCRHHFHFASPSNHSVLAADAGLEN